MSEYHRPIMEDEVVEGLCLKKGGVYFDGTVGGGGHSYAILSGNPEVTVVATDKDTEAIEEATKRLSPFSGQVRNLPQRFQRLRKGVRGSGNRKDRRVFTRSRHLFPSDRRRKTRLCLSLKKSPARYENGSKQRLLR